MTFRATSGGVAVTSGTTDTAGAAIATLSSGGDPTLRTITVTATAGSLRATVAVQVVAGTGSVTVQIGGGIGAAFTAGTIAVSNPSWPAGGSTSQQVVLQQSDGTLYSQSATISCSSPCAAQNVATLTPSVTTTTGIAAANYTSASCNGADTITATSPPASTSGLLTLTVARPGGGGSSGITTTVQYPIVVP